MKKIYVFIVALCIILSGCSKQGNSEPNSYFFPDETEDLTVKCKMNMIDEFNGEATLQINKLEGTKLDNYYELVLTNLKGTCNEHVDIDDSKCEYYSDFHVGYFYVEGDKIYMMSYDEKYLNIFAEIDMFPPANEYIESWNKELHAVGEHYGYFDYRLVCSEEGFEDTFGTKYSIDEKYHNYITVDGDERRYNLWPETSGTQEYMYITWRKDEGIYSFANWSGNFKGRIEFGVELYTD